MPKITIGNRIYHKDGDKEDARGKYFGKSSVCDETIPLHSIRIQKSQTYSKMSGFELTGKFLTDKTVKVEKSADEVNKDQDLSDLLLVQSPGEIIFATERTKCKSTMLVSLLNEFGHA